MALPTFPFTVTGKASPFETSNGYAPKGGPKVIAKTISFTAAITQILLELQRIEDTEKLEIIQSLFIDNSKNPAPLYVTQPVVNSHTIVKAGSQAILPILSVIPAIEFDSLGGQIANGTVNVNIHFLNFMVPACVWDTGGGLILDHSANAPALSANLLGTAAPNAQRVELYAQNQSANPLQLVLDDAAGNNQSIILLAPGVGANNQGADYTSTAFKGRARVFSNVSANDQMVLRES